MKACPGARYNITNIVESICENRIQKKKHGSGFKMLSIFLLNKTNIKQSSLLKPCSMNEETVGL